MGVTASNSDTSFLLNPNNKTFVKPQKRIKCHTGIFHDSNESLNPFFEPADSFKWFIKMKLHSPNLVHTETKKKKNRHFILRLLHYLSFILDEKGGKKKKKKQKLLFSTSMVHTK